MKRNIFNSLLVVAFISVISGCKTKKPIVKVPAASETAIDTKRSETIKTLKDMDIAFNTLSLKARASLDINGNTNSVTMNFRMEKGKKIWVSITAIAGIEVARALITPDSIKVRNNLQGVYLKKPFSYVHTFTNKQVDFELLEAILSGNTISGFFNEQAGLSQNNGVWVLDGTKEELAYRVLFNTLFKVAEDTLNDIRSGRSLKVVYGEYQQINDALFPSSIKINSMAGTKRVNVNLDFSKIERNLPLDFPFNVPKKYEVIN